ncbi:MAG: hypothetical protein V4537_01955 [Pseudomonadota bacterium]
MRGAVLSFFLILAIMLGSAHAPAVAHPQGESAVQVIDLLDSDHHAIDAPDGRSPDGKGEVAQHHHCGVSLGSGAPGICRRTPLDGAKPVPALASTLASISHAPLIEPPAA